MANIISFKSFDLKQEFYRDFKNFDQNWDFQKSVTKIHIFGNFKQNRDFSKNWRKSRFFETFERNQDFRKFWPAAMEISENSNHNWDFFPSRNFSENWPNLRFLLIFRPKLRCFENLDQNRDFPRNWQKWRFSIKVDQNRDFQQFWSKSRFFEKFQGNRDISKILNTIKIIGNLNQTWNN